MADQEALFSEMARIAKPGGSVYVFEPTLRELHQAPDDYLRYTPFGMRNALARAGLEPGNFEVDGGPFSAIAYCWTQALQYFPQAERERMEKWLDIALEEGIRFFITSLGNPRWVVDRVSQVGGVVYH